MLDPKINDIGSDAKSPCRSLIPGPKVMLLGEPGSGKTTSAATYLDAGITPFFLFTDPGMEVLPAQPEGEPCKIHWVYHSPATPDWASMIDGASKINTLSFQALTKLGDINRGKHNTFIKVLGSLANFTCARCEKSFGPVDSWNTDRALILDNMTGLSQIAMDLVVGSKPVKAMADWGVAMDNLGRLILRLTTAVHTHVCVVGHLEREQDEVSGAVRLMVSTLGRKLAPTLGRTFSDIIMTQMLGDRWVWTTESTNVALKIRNLPVGRELPPNFKPLIENWKSRGGVICPSEEQS